MSHVTVLIDRSQQTGTSQLTLGVTPTQDTLDWPNQEAEARVIELLRQSGLKYWHVPWMGWGCANPNPAPGEYMWRDLDKRYAIAEAAGLEMTITFCGCPNWMNGTAAPGETKWGAAAMKPPLAEHEGHFAELATLVAQRYPKVKRFVVWAELRQMWNSAEYRWDIERYVRLYNTVIDAVKAVRHDATFGGPYMVAEGNGAAARLGVPLNKYTQRALSPMNVQTLEYFFANARAIDVVAINHRTAMRNDSNVYTWQQYLDLMPTFADAVESLRKVKGYKGQPIWMMETYPWKFADTVRKELPSIEYQATSHALMLLIQMKSGLDVSLRWAPEPREGKFDNATNTPDGATPRLPDGATPRLPDQALWNNTKTPDGGQPYPNYFVYQAFARHFGPGTPLYRTATSNTHLHILASDKKAILVNTAPEALTVAIDDRLVVVAGHGWRQLDLEGI